MTKRPLIDPLLKFDEAKHTYKVGRKKLVSVTQFIKQFFLPFNEKEIAKRVAYSRRAKGEKITAKQIIAEWHKTAEDGTLVHKEIEDYITGEKDLLEVANQKSLSGINYYHSLRTTYPGALFYPEVRIYSEKYGLAGTIDLLIITMDGAVIVDWKTNKKLEGGGRATKFNGVAEDKLSLYSLQLSTYAHILEEEYGYPCKKLILAHLNEETTTVIPVTYFKSVVMEMIALGKKEDK
jgi:ATP-dependent exoDNAse (exonuclease V) beta subunit